MHIKLIQAYSSFFLLLVAVFTVSVSRQFSIYSSCTSAILEWILPSFLILSCGWRAHKMSCTVGNKFGMLSTSFCSFKDYTICQSRLLYFTTYSGFNIVRFIWAQDGPGWEIDFSMAFYMSATETKSLYFQ